MGETGNTKELSEAEEMAIFKKEFYAEIDKIPRNFSLACSIIDTAVF